MIGRHDHQQNTRGIGEALEMATERGVQLDAYLNDADWETPRDLREDTRGILNPDDFISWMETR
jgi:hypothetical protein